MTANSYLPWAIAVLLVIGLAIVLVSWLSASRRHRTEIGELRARADRLEEAIADFRDRAARLPDVIDRAARAEAESAERLQRLDDIVARYAALQATEKALQGTTHDLSTNLVTEQNTVAELRLELGRARDRLSGSEAELRAANALLAELRGEIARLKAHIETLGSERMQALQTAAQAEAERDAARSLQERTAQFLTEAQSALRASFTEAASKVFDEKSQSLEKRINDSADASKTGLQATLQPFAEHVIQFQQRLEAITTENVKARSELSGKIDALTNLNQNMAVAADSLTKALKGNAKLRGDWGEMVLESVLAASGLKEGLNYARQPTERDEETGNRQRPDIVVKLPDKRKVVVDAKVNLDAWKDAVNTDDKSIESEALQKHVAALRRHVSDLANSNYPALYPGEALQITIAFVPIESALSKALEISPDLQQEAFRRGIAFATPNTLMAMLQVVERLWVRDTLHKQITSIGNEAGKLLDSVSSFLSEFESLEQHFNRTDRQLKSVRSKLETSPQSVLARTKRLVEAGARGKKKLHASLLEASTGNDEALPLLNDTSGGDSEERDDDVDRGQEHD